MSLKYFMYCRKSTEGEDRQILSLPAQLSELQQVAEKEHLDIVDTYVESASAYKIGRPEFNKMVERLHKGEADAILVWAYNRIARNSKDGGEIIYLLDSGILKEIRTPSGKTDGSGNSKFMLALEFAMSKKSSDDNSESVKRGNRAKILGGWSIKKHAGYMFVEDPATGEKIIAIDPGRFLLVKKAFEMVLEYKSPPKILEILNEEWGYRTPKTRKQGGKPMSMSNLYKILHNEFYSGWIYTDEGQRVNGKHEPMITDAQYDKVQEILGAKGKPRPKDLSLPYRGLMTCGECGCSICLQEKHQIICPKCKLKFSSKNKEKCPGCGVSITRMKGETRLHYIYAGCTKKKRDVECKQKSINMEKLEGQIKTYLESLYISPRLNKWVLNQLKHKTGTQMAINDQALKNLQKVVHQSQRDLDSLLAQYTQPENIDRKIISTEAYMKRKGELEATKKKAESDLEDLSRKVRNFMLDTEEEFDFATTASEEFNNGGYEKRTEVFRKLGENLTLLNQKVLMDESKLHYFIRKANADIKTISADRLEPEKSIDIYEKTGVVTPVISTLQAWKESNLRWRFWTPPFAKGGATADQVAGPSGLEPEFLVLETNVLPLNDGPNLAYFNSSLFKSPV